MKYICLVYQEEQNLENMSEQDIARTVSEVGSWINDLEQSGTHVFSSGLQAPETAATLRMRNGEVTVTDGPFSETKEFLGGFTIIEARDLNEAVMQATKLATACRGTIEVRPEMNPFGDMQTPLDKKLAAAIRKSIENSGAKV